MIRSARPTDQAYVASTWVSSMARGKDARAARLLVDRILDRADVKVTVTAGELDANHIDGWLCYTRIVGSKLTDKPRHLVHFAYVREPCRRKGMLTAMLQREGIELRGMMWSFTGPLTKKLQGNLLAGAIHVPPAQFLGEKP